MKNRFLNVSLFVSICTVLTAGAMLAYNMGRAAEGSTQAQRVLEQAREDMEARASLFPMCFCDANNGDQTDAGEEPDEDALIEQALLANGYFRDDVPLSYELQDVLQTACREARISYELALGLIWTESRFDPDAVSVCGCYGYMQLHPSYFPDDLDPADNLQAGVSYLGELMERYGDLDAALTAYHLGHDDGSREYAQAVHEAAERYGGVCDVGLSNHP